MIEAKQPINCVALHPNQVYFLFSYYYCVLQLILAKYRWTFLLEMKTVIYYDGIFELVH